MQLPTETGRKYLQPDIIDIMRYGVRRQPIVLPPFIDSTWPVMSELSSDAKKSTAAATSS